jgi:predicted nucleic acid-binding protein
MILVDTSIWIQLLNSDLSQTITDDRLLLFATCGPVIQEVSQGLRDSPKREVIVEGLLALPRLADPLPTSLYLEAAAIYRLGRRKGYTIRSSIDCLIAAIAIRNNTPVWHCDRDYVHIARYTSLELVQPPALHA